MVEEWRIKRYYRPRVLIETQDVLAPLFPDAVICLTGAQLCLLRNLTQYLHRRVTFVSSYEEQYYLTPTEEEWDDLQAIVSDLEDKLMECEAFTQKLEEILDAALCACESARERAYLGEIPTPPLGQESPFYYGEGIPDGPMAPDEAACAVAQCWYQFGYEFITEHVLPISRVGFDILLPAVVGFIALVTGGPVAALGYYTVAELIQNLMQGFYNAAETNLVNWLESNKQELVCAVYTPLAEGTTASAAWENAWITVVLPAEDISEMDKWIVDLFMGPWCGLNAQAAWDAQTAWALSSVTPGYCDECEQPPIQGEGWFAQWVNGQVYYCEILKASPYWPEIASIQVPKLTTHHCAGLLWELTQAGLEGGIDGRNGNLCTAANVHFTSTPHNARDTVGTQLSMEPGKPYQAEVEAALLPGITQTANVRGIAAAQEIACSTWKCEGGHTQPFVIRVRWLIYEGTL